MELRLCYGYGWLDAWITFIHGNCLSFKTCMDIQNLKVITMIKLQMNLKKDIQASK